MADRRITVLNPDGYQEVLQTADRLFVDSVSQLAQTNFSGNISGTNGAFTGSLTVQAVPTEDKDVVTLDFIEDVIVDLTLSAALPITLTGKEIGINNATDALVGAVRFATDAEVNNRSVVDAAVKPDQLDAALDSIVINSVAPIQITEDPTNTWTVEIDYATNATAGSIRIATDSEANAQVLETVAINPKQLSDRIGQIPYATVSTPGLIQLASGSQITEGTNNNTAVTPAQLKQEVDTVTVTAQFPIGVIQTDRTFDIDIAYATDTSRGVMRFCTSAELADGTSTEVAITPHDLETRLGGLEIVDGSTTNKGLVRFATNSETAAGTETDAANTPAGLRYALDQPDYVLDGGTY